MKLRLLLAHFSEIQNGLLFALGIGWTEIGPDPNPLSIAAIIEVPWDETNRPHDLLFEIIDADGQPLLVPGPAGDQPVQFKAGFDVGRPPGVTPGRSFVMPVSLNIGPLPMRPGRQYVVRASVDGQVMDETSFIVRPAPAQPNA